MRSDFRGTGDGGSVGGDQMRTWAIKAFGQIKTFTKHLLCSQIKSDTKLPNNIEAPEY